MRHPKHQAIPTNPPQPIQGLEPKRPYLTAVKRFAQRVPELRAIFDPSGHVRTLTTDSDVGLFNEPLLTTPAQHARKFLNVEDVTQALGLRHADLAIPTVTDMPTLGHVVTFRQEVVTTEGRRFPVRQGYVHVYMDEVGKVYAVNSTLRYGRRNVNLDGIITDVRAIELAKDDVKFESYCHEHAELVFSSHNGKVEPVYEVLLRQDEPRKSILVLIKAQTGEIVHRQDRIYHSTARKMLLPSSSGAIVPMGAKRRRTPPTAGGPTGNAPVMGKSFLRVPDPNAPIGPQVFQVVLESLPDPKVLKNDNLIMYVGNRKSPVRCKADGTFNYSPNDPEFSAVTTFFSLNIQIELMKKWGMKPFEKPIPCFVEDRSVTDNAYFDPEGWEIHIGIGSGLSSGGLSRYIAYDIGVARHEAGHTFVFVQTPGKDLPGPEGGAIHESTGDTLGTLLMDWWCRLKFAQQLGVTITPADVDADARIIGTYAAGPQGIRNLKNKKRTPKDKTGEVHDDGEISGAAKSDLMVAMVLAQGIEKGLEDFGQMFLAALALVPAHKVTFRDLLNAFLTADTKLFAGANKALITKAFGDHGIVLASGKGGGGGRTPIIIVIS